MPKQLKDFQLNAEQTPSMEDFLVEVPAKEGLTLDLFYQAIMDKDNTLDGTLLDVNEKSILSYIMLPVPGTWLDNYLTGAAKRARKLRYTLLEKLIDYCQIVGSSDINPLHYAFTNPSIDKEEFSSIVELMASRYMLRNKGAVEKERASEGRIEMFMTILNKESDEDTFSQLFLGECKNELTPSFMTSKNIYKKYTKVCHWMRGDILVDAEAEELYDFLASSVANVEKPKEVAKTHAPIYNRVLCTCYALDNRDLSQGIDKSLAIKKEEFGLKLVDKEKVFISEEMMLKAAIEYRSITINKQPVKDIVSIVLGDTNVARKMMPFVTAREILELKLSKGKYNDMVKWYLSDENTRFAKQDLVDENGENNQACWVIKNFPKNIDEFFLQRANEIRAFTMSNMAILVDGSVNPKLAKKKNLIGINAAECRRLGAMPGRKNILVFKAMPTVEQFKSYVQEYYRGEGAVGIINNQGFLNQSCFLVQNYPTYLEALLETRIKAFKRHINKGIEPISEDGSINTVLLEDPILVGIDANECHHYQSTLEREILKKHNEQAVVLPQAVASSQGLFSSGSMVQAEKRKKIRSKRKRTENPYQRPVLSRKSTGATDNTDNREIAIGALMALHDNSKMAKEFGSSIGKTDSASPFSNRSSEELDSTSSFSNKGSGEIDLDIDALSQGVSRSGPTKESNTGEKHVIGDDDETISEVSLSSTGTWIESRNNRNYKNGQDFAAGYGISEEVEAQSMAYNSSKGDSTSGKDDSHDSVFSIDETGGEDHLQSDGDEKKDEKTKIMDLAYSTDSSIAENNDLQDSDFSPEENSGEDDDESEVTKNKRPRQSR